MLPVAEFSLTPRWRSLNPREAAGVAAVSFGIRTNGTSKRDIKQSQRTKLRNALRLMKIEQQWIFK